MIEAAAIVMALCLVVIALAAVAALVRVSAVAREVSRLAATIEAEVRPLARELSRAADHVTDVLAVVRVRLRKTDDAVDAMTERVVRVSDRLLAPIEDLAAVLHGVEVGLGFLFRKRRP